ncbi:glycoside hydrolase family 16 protein [Corynebacterium aquilae]|uniref:GH16 domain-containing protein n=1 Tax=Corynebacterium aquilae DSM 44791 TaxID=1431546 RepID=A0A1L7CEY3_9CORY|nr:family 16 glycosylhydrolase [Corynebacterium aquilae]APT84396.1 hypothetical protein CAQU_04155 [Corynebacterium aquilae DSM 44791]
MTMRPRTRTLALALAAITTLAALPAPAASAEEQQPAAWAPTIDPPTDSLAANPLSAPTREHIGREARMATDEDISTTLDDDSAVADWKFMERRHYYNDKLLVSRKYTSFEDGVLDIKTRRHCVSGDETPSDGNVSTAPCPAGTTTLYTTSRMQTPLIPKGNMRIQIRAKNTTPEYVPGIRPSLWLQSESPYCHNDQSSRYGEYDLVEYFSAYPDKQHSNTHIGCVNIGHRPEMVSRNTVWDSPIVNEWHTWGLEVFDNQIVYTLDGKVVVGPTDAENFNVVSPKIFSEVLDQRYRIILDTFLEPQGTLWIAGVKDNKDFPEHHFLIDEILVEHEVDDEGNIVQPEKLTDPFPKVFIPGGSHDQLGSSLPVGSTPIPAITGENVAKFVGIFAGVAALIGGVWALINHFGLAPQVELPFDPPQLPPLPHVELPPEIAALIPAHER